MDSNACIILKSITDEFILEWLKSNESCEVIPCKVPVPKEVSYFFNDRKLAKNSYKVFQYVTTQSENVSYYYIVVDSDLCLTRIKYALCNSIVIRQSIIIFSTSHKNNCFNDQFNSWVIWLQKHFNDTFLHFYFFKNLDTRTITNYVNSISIGAKPLSSLINIIDTSKIKIYSYIDNSGYEYRIQINHNLNSFLFKSQFSINDIMDDYAYVPRFDFIISERTAFIDYLKNDYFK